MDSIGRITAQGAFTGDFGIAPGIPAHRIPAEIERDREQMARRPGMRIKHVPVRIDPDTGEVSCGGRYLFDTYEQAEDYRRWVEDEFAPDGVPFPRRPYFVAPRFLAWRVVQAHQMAPLREHAAVRLERWSLTDAGCPEDLSCFWPIVFAEAARRGLASVWLLHSRERREMGLVTVAGRRSAVPEAGMEAVGRLTGSSVADAVEALGWGERTWDHAGMIWSVWLPRAAPGAPPALWPNSPPLPAPAAPLAAAGAAG